MWSRFPLRTARSSVFLICVVLVVNLMLAAFPVPVAAQENLVENGNFSQGLEHWVVGGPTNPCQPRNASDVGGYYGCIMVTDEGTLGNPHLELWTGNGGGCEMERFEQDVYKPSLNIPKDARITLSLRAWSLGNHSYVRVAIDRGPQGNLTVDEIYTAEFDNYEAFHVPSREPTTITRDISMFNLGGPVSLLVAGDQVAIDDISMVAAAPPAEPVFLQQTELTHNGDFSQGTSGWQYWGGFPPAVSYCCMTTSETGTPGNPHLELQTPSFSPPGQVFQEIPLPQGAARISLSIKAWAHNFSSTGGIVPWVDVGITPGGVLFNGTLGEPETYVFGKNALMVEPPSVITRDLTGFAGKTVTVSITMGNDTSVDDVTILATWPYFGLPATAPALVPVAALIIVVLVGGFLRLRHVRRRKSSQNKNNR